MYYTEGHPSDNRLTLYTVCTITDKAISDNRLLTDEEQEKLFALRSFLTTEINIETVNLLVTTGCISDGHKSARAEQKPRDEQHEKVRHRAGQ